MNDLNINFADTNLSPRHTPERMTGRSMTVEYKDGRFRVMVVDAGRYLLFYGESEPVATEEHVPEGPISNQLTVTEDGKVKVIDGKKYTVAGYGGRATLAPKKEKVEVLARVVPGMFEIKTDSEGAETTIRKIGTRYQVFSIRDGYLTFFADEEVGPGFPTATLQNKLLLADAHAKKMIDGTVYLVGGHGGQVTIEPSWFEGKRPLN